MVIENENTPKIKTPLTIHDFPSDKIKISGNETIDFLQRITTNDFSNFVFGSIKKTLLVTDKGRIVDAVWALHQQDHVLLVASNGYGQEIITWLNKYIIMEDIVLSDVSSKYQINLHFNSTNTFLDTDYFGIPVSMEIREEQTSNSNFVSSEYEMLRIEYGIPSIKKELTHEYNPLELNLWDWISFTKGCYIGQEVIARLDTYNKIQRFLCKISSSNKINEQEILLDESGSEIGKITSVLETKLHFFGLAVIRKKNAIHHEQLRSKENGSIIRIEKVFQKDGYGRN